MLVQDFLNKIKDLAPICGIYAIICNKTWRSYVGQSENIYKRIMSHLQVLKRNCHENKTLQHDFNLYKIESFYIEILENTNNVYNLGKLEAKWCGFGENMYNSTLPNIKPKLYERDLQRFWSKVDKTSGLGTGECWEWRGSKTKGYGVFSVRKDGIKKSLRVHRISYFLFNPNDDFNLLIRHKCNNAVCVNPTHLILGTTSENINDMLFAGTKGNLNWDLVNEIRNKFIEDPNIDQHKFAKWFQNKFNKTIIPNHIINIALNKKWINKQYQPPFRISQKGKSLLSYKKSLILNKNEIKLFITKLHNQKIKYIDIKWCIYDIFGINITLKTISNLIKKINIAKKGSD